MLISLSSSKFENCQLWMFLWHLKLIDRLQRNQKELRMQSKFLPIDLHSQQAFHLIQSIVHLEECMGLDTVYRNLYNYNPHIQGKYNCRLHSKYNSWFGLSRICKKLKDSNSLLHTPDLHMQQDTRMLNIEARYSWSYIMRWGSYCKCLMVGRAKQE